MTDGSWLRLVDDGCSLWMTDMKEYLDWFGNGTIDDSTFYECV